MITTLRFKGHNLPSLSKLVPGMVICKAIVATNTLREGGLRRGNL